MVQIDAHPSPSTQYLHVDTMYRHAYCLHTANLYFHLCIFARGMYSMSTLVLGIEMTVLTPACFGPRLLYVLSVL